MPDIRKILAATAGVAAVTGVAGAAARRIRNHNGNGTAEPVYRVAPDGDAWVVDAADGSGAKRYETKRQALSSGRSLARSHAPSRLVIHRADGTIQRQHTYETDL